MEALAVSSPQQNLVEVLTKGAIENYQGSVTLMKQLTVAAVSAIVYFKDAFPEDSYNTEKFRDLKLKILKKKCRDEAAQFLSTALINALDAFDKKYLHRLMLCFYNDECRMENLIDYHIFEYTYHKEGARLRVHSRSDVDEKAYSMLQSCIAINDGFQKKLPGAVDISLRLYYNEDAPENYQAPGYRTGVEFEEHLSPADMAMYLLGDVGTAHHGVRVTSHFFESSGSSHEAIASQNPPLMTQTEDFAATWSSSGSPAAAVRCPCHIDRADLPHDITKLITCDYCKTQQHAACFGLLRGTSRHCCASCSDEDRTRSPTCPDLAAMGKKREFYCAVRLALSWCAARGAVSAADLRALGIAPRIVDKPLLPYLRSKDLLERDDFNISQKVNETGLRAMMKSYFHDLEEHSLVDRLVEETLSSQDSQHDLVAEVLSPMEMASLREATGSGRVIRTKPAPAPSALLKQYRGALTSSLKDDDEPPLASTLEKMEMGRKKRKLEPDTITFMSTAKPKRSRGLFEDL